MLINALARMTRESRAYVFLDQGLTSRQGQIDLQNVQKRNTPRPDIYVRGSISQFDSAVGSTRLRGDADHVPLDSEADPEYSLDATYSCLLYTSDAADD